jgi:hypothetical protein
MSSKNGILCLGTRPDATTWEKGCRALGFDTPLPIKKPSPTMDELKAFFGRSYDWVFLAGHFSGGRLYNESGTVGVRFSAEAVVLEVGSDTVELRRGTSALGLSAPALVLWGGCSTLGSTATVSALHTLFGSHTMIGFQAMTGWRMVDAMLGQGFMKDKRHFFTRVTADSTAEELRTAWMETARLGYAGGDLEDRFAAVDPNGQRWVLRDKKVVRDAKLF